MGAFAASFAFALVVAHTTLLLLDSGQRASWTFSLVEQRGGGAYPVLAAWDPHLILHALCGANLVVCLSRAQRKAAQAQPDGQRYFRLMQLLDMRWAVGVQAALTLALAILGALRSADALRYTTALALAAEYGGAAWYAARFEAQREDLDWTLAVHLQLVGVPLTALMLAAMGVRFWVDVLGHAALLSAAVSAYWMQSGLRAPYAREVARVATVALLAYCACEAAHQLGPGRAWQKTVALLAATSLAPLLLLTALRAVHAPARADDDRDWDKVQLRVAHLCTSGALLSAVVSLAVMW